MNLRDLLVDLNKEFYGYKNDIFSGLPGSRAYREPNTVSNEAKFSQKRPNFKFFWFPPPGRICKVGQNQRISSTIIRCFPFGSHSRSNKNSRKIMSCAVWRKYVSGPRRKQPILHCDWLICYDIYVVIGCTSK